MVACDNKNCGIKWFHISCLKMTNAPTGKWLCLSYHPTKKSGSNATKNQPEMSSTNPNAVYKPKIKALYM